MKPWAINAEAWAWVSEAIGWSNECGLWLAGLA